MAKNIIYLSDKGGCGMWRHIFQTLAHDTNSKSDANQFSTTFTTDLILDPNYYADVVSVSIQRWNSLHNLDMFRRFIKPVCDKHQIYLLYHIDDDMHYKHIPLYNRGRPGYVGDKVQNGIKEMLNGSDFVIVTTDYIKKTYHEVYDVPLENIIAIPNLLPRYWFGDRYRPEEKVAQFNKNKNRPRIGIVSSLSHYNLEGVRCLKSKQDIAVKYDAKRKVWATEENKIVPEEETMIIEDDMSQIIPLIKETVNDFKWVLFGYTPSALESLVNEKKIEYYPCVPILNYASRFDNLNLQAVVVPLKKGEFNFCKSHIKTMEASALGVPIFAQNCLPYDRVMRREFLFDDAKELKEKLIKFKFSSSGSFRKIIEDNWKWLNSPHHEGDVDIRNYWLEDNMNVWEPIFHLRKKPIQLSFNKFCMLKKEQKESELKNTIYKSDDGCLILK